MTAQHAGPSSPRVPPSTPTVLGRLARALERARALRAQIERARGRSRVLDATFETIERDSEIGGGILAGALAYRLFVFALPLVFFLVSAIGLLADALGIRVHDLAQDLGLSGVVAEEVANSASGDSKIWVLLVSFGVLVYVTRVLLRTIAVIHALAWGRSGAAVTVGRRSLGVFSAALAGQLALVVGVSTSREQSETAGALALLAFVAGVAALWLWLSLELPHASARWVDLIPGAIVYGIGILCVKVFNSFLLASLVDSMSTTYGALGIAAAILLSLFLLGRVVVAAAVLNATLHERRSRSRAPKA